jgi:hypothetical protein
MRRLVIQGLPPAEAARCAHLGNESAGLQMNVAAPAGGGNVVPLPGSTATARGLARAATSMDSNGMTQIVSEAIAERGTIWTWEQVISPVLIGLGKRWEMTGEGIELEHLLTESLKGCFKEVTSRLKTPVNSRAVLLSCAPEELHSLGVSLGTIEGFCWSFRGSRGACFAPHCISNCCRARMASRFTGKSCSNPRHD